MDDNVLQPAPAVFVATIQVKRAATGKVETFEVVGTPLPPEQPEQLEDETK